MPESTTRTRLTDLVEPVFQTLCRLNRQARKGLSLDETRVRADVLGTLSEIRTRAEDDVHLRAQWEKVELPLIYMLDSMLLRILPRWSSLAEERRMMGGDQRFFEHLDETLQDSSNDSDERLLVFYSCLGLGFTGMYANNPEHVKRKMAEVHARVRHLVESDPAARTCPEAYGYTDTRMLTQPTGRSLVALVILFVGMVGMLLGLNVVMYKSATDQINDDLQRISNVSQQAVEVISQNP